MSKMASLLALGGGGQHVTLGTIELNAEIDDALFTMPAGGGVDH
jgi:hypothetical protein